MFYTYTVLLGDKGIVKCGWTNNIERRLGEHGRKYGCPKKAILLSCVKFTSKASAEEAERNLIQACKDAGLRMVIDKQNGKTERFYVNPEVAEVQVKGRKLTYNFRVS